MSKEEQILNLIKANNGIITSKEISKHGINRMFLTRLVKSEKIERVKKGLYVLPNTWGDEYFNLIYGINAIFSYDTALYFLGLCETVPSVYHITVCRGYNGKLNHNGNVKLHFIKKKILELGKIEIKSPQGQIIACYNAERSICDLLKNKDKDAIKDLIINHIKYPINHFC